MVTRWLKAVAQGKAAVFHEMRVQWPCFATR